MRTKSAQPLRLQGQYFDPEIDLCYNRHRYFDPHICSFISQDPLGLAAGENVYAYAPNVWGWVDPLGLCKEGALTGSIKESFKNGKYEKFILDQDIMVYRASDYVPNNSQVGDFFGDVRPLNSLDAEELYNIRKWNNNAHNLGIYKIKAGTEVYYGGVAGGAGNQFYIPDANNLLKSGDISLIKTEQLFITAEKAFSM